jgi:hypothetical protein
MEQEDFIFVIEESKNKNEQIQEKTQEIFSQLLKKMNPRGEESEQEYSLRLDRERNFIEETYLQIIKKIDFRLKKPMEDALYKSGYATRDPYFLANFKALMPIIKKQYFDLGVTAMMILHNFNPEATNKAILQFGEGWINQFLAVIKEYAEEYNKKLYTKGIDETMKPVRIKGIPLGVVKDIIGNMKRYKSRMKKEMTQSRRTQDESI